MLLLILVLAVFFINIPFGYFREGFKRMSWQWLVILHLPVPFVILLRKAMGFDIIYAPLLILAAIIAQYIGGRPIRRYIKGLIKSNRDSKSL